MTPSNLAHPIGTREQWLAEARWNGQSLSSGQRTKMYGFTDIDDSQPDCWRFFVKFYDPGKPADATGYR